MLDVELVRALRRRDSDADDQLVERYGEHVYRIAAGLIGPGADAEEATQCALATAARMIDTLESNGNFRAWIDRLAAGAAYRKLRSRARAGQAVATVSQDDALPPIDAAGHFEPMSDWSDRIDDSALRGELRQIMREGLEALPPAHRAALVLHDVESMPDAEVAAVLGVDVEAARRRVHQARLFLRRRLSEHLEPVHSVRP